MLMFWRVLARHLEFLQGGLCVQEGACVRWRVCSWEYAEAGVFDEFVCSGERVRAGCGNDNAIILCGDACSVCLLEEKYGGGCCRVRARDVGEGVASGVREPA